MFITVLFTVTKIWKPPKWLSVIKKMWYMYTKECSAFKKKEILPFATAWMKLESIVLSETSQTQ